MARVADTHKDKTITLWFQDEARVGQKGRVCHRWYRHGERPPGRKDQRFTFVYIFGAVRPGTDEAWGLVMPWVNKEMMGSTRR